MTEIKITLTGIRKELIMLLSHIADVRGEKCDDYIRKVAAIDDDTDLLRLISDTQISGIAASLPHSVTLDIDCKGYTLTCPTDMPPLTLRTIKRLLTTYIVSMIAGSWSELIGWPYSQATDNAAQSALQALTAILRTPPRRILPPL